MCAGGRASSKPGLHRTEFTSPGLPGLLPASYLSWTFLALLLRPSAFRFISFCFFPFPFSFFFALVPLFPFCLPLETVQCRPSRPGTILQASNGVSQELLSSLSRARVGARRKGEGVVAPPPKLRPVPSRPSVNREPHVQHHINQDHRIPIQPRNVRISRRRRPTHCTCVPPIFVEL